MILLVPLVVLVIAIVIVIVIVIVIAIATATGFVRGIPLDFVPPPLDTLPERILFQFNSKPQTRRSK